jgi:hypothetical protein
VTWGAPQALRPGAVWSHVLIVGGAEVGRRRALDALLALPRRPEQAPDLDRYRAPLKLGSGSLRPPRELDPTPHDRPLLELLVAATYGPHEPAIVVHSDRVAAARAALALWRAQWPALRASFSFRTRQEVRTDSNGYDLTVTAKLRSHADHAAAEHQPPPASRWVAALGEDLLTVAPTPLREFLWAFGPFEPCEPRSVKRLTQLWLQVDAGDAERARARLERNWPSPHAGARLKRALFGCGEEHWWHLDERARVHALLHANRAAWDLDELELASRARALTRRQAARPGQPHPHR